MADVVQLVGIGYDRLTTNMRKSFDGMSPEKWIRVVIIVGTYMLLRPYLLKLGGRSQMKQHEREAAEAEEEAKRKEAAAKMSPNEFRGHKVEVPDDSDEEEDGDGAQGAQASAADWGKKARRRQRTMVRKLIEAEEKRLQELQEDDEDKDIQEFLTD